MSRPDMSLAVVGAIHDNKDRSNRLFEIQLCAPGESVDLVPEPKNPFDPSAIAIFSVRGIQIGYVSAERCGWIGARMAQGEEIRGIFQEAVKGGAIIRISFSGEDPILPPPRPAKVERADAEGDSGFYPDFIPPDD
ncbi:HIRAN domain-containing protein [Sphingobium olei]